MIKRSSNKAIPKIQLSRTIQKNSDETPEMKPMRSECKDAVKWSDAEIQALEEGVSKYGHKSWKKIIRNNRNVFDDSRRVIDLVNKYNQMHKSSSYYTTNKKDWIMVDSECNPIIDGLGEIIVISEKFPYDAAKKFAKKKIASGESEFIVNIREAENIENQHFYKVSLKYGKICMRKIVPDVASDL